MDDEEKKDDYSALYGGVSLLRQIRLVSSMGVMVVLCVCLGFVGGWLVHQYGGLGVSAAGAGGMAGAVLGLFWASRRLSAVLGRISQEERQRKLREAERQLSEQAAEETSGGNDQAVAPDPEKVDSVAGGPVPDRPEAK